MINYLIILAQQHCAEEIDKVLENWEGAKNEVQEEGWVTHHYERRYGDGCKTVPTS